MGKSLLLKPVSVVDYLELEKVSSVKHEYIEGMLFEMPGSSSVHNRLITNLVGLLWLLVLKKGCRIFSSDMKVRALEGIFYYPDVMVVCEEEPNPYYQDKPCLIIEVLSPSTETTDRREKLLAYQKLPTLQTYLLVSSEAQRVEGYYRQKDGWQYRLIEETGEVSFAPVELSLTLGDIYQGL